MGVENADVIDLLVRHPKNRELILIMVEVRDWNESPEAVEQLQAKFRAYAEYMVSDALAKDYPDLEKGLVQFRLGHFAPLHEAAIEVLRQWAGKLSGINVGVCSHRLYLNPLRHFFQRLATRFRGVDHGVVLWAAEPNTASVPLLSAEFTEEFAAALRKSIPVARVTVTGELELKVVTGEDEDRQCHLHNTYNSYCLAPQNKDELFRKFIASIGELADLETGIIDRSRLVPILKDTAWIEEIKRALAGHGKGKPITNVHEPYNEELSIVYAVDTPSNVRYLTADDFAGLRMEMTELRSLACANLQTLIAEPDVRIEDGIYRIKADGDYDACILLLDEFWEIANIPVKGELVAAIPSRDYLVVTGSKNLSDVARLRRMAESMAARASYRLTPKLFVRRGGKFVVYEG